MPPFFLLAGFWVTAADFFSGGKQAVEMVCAEFWFPVVYSLNMKAGATVIQPHCAPT